MQVNKILRKIDFPTLLSEASYQTQTGKSLIKKYQSAIIYENTTSSDSISCMMINTFLKEAKGCLYDAGVLEVYNNISNIIAENKYSWLLATACEQINKDSNQYNFLNRNAAKQVEKLLEMEENDVKSYIKAGALKNVMFVESFRNIAKALFNDSPIVEQNVEFRRTHPISITEQKNGAVYFVVGNKLYKNVNGEILEANTNEVSNDFKMIHNFLENQKVSYANETITYTTENATYSIKEEGFCEKTTKIDEEKTKTITYTTEQLREQNSIYVNGAFPSKRKQTEYELECLAKVCENFDKIAILGNVNLFETATDRFVIIENKDKYFAELIASNRVAPSSYWSVCENIYDVVNFVKKKTGVQLKDVYESEINTAIEVAEEKEGEQIKESLEKSEMEKRKERIEKLTEQYKNNPVKLAVLAKLSEQLYK